MSNLNETIERQETIIKLYEAKYNESAKEDREVLQFLEELKKYKETGLTPELIIAMDKLYGEKCKEVEALKTYKR